jgi:D-amino-acid dehydrogenase
MHKPEVLIIGGGIVGVACAAELAQRGLSVAIVERGQIGHGCSYGNAGLLTPCHAFPLPMPGVLRQGLKWLVDPDSPLRIAPRVSWGLVSWLLRFAMATNRKQAMRGLRALVELSLFSLNAYKQWDQSNPGAFEFAQNGLVVAARTPAGLQAAHEEVHLVGELGVRGGILDVRALRRLEPAVTGRDVIGGAYFPDEATVEPLATVQFLARRCEELGVRIIPGTEVFDFDRIGRKIESIQTTGGRFSADRFVLATGAWSGRVARLIGLRIPMLSGKGYSIILDPLDPMPRAATLLLETKVALTPRRDSVRLAGTLELVDVDESITVRRVQAIMRGARAYVNLPAEPRVIEVWRGLRPCLPDGLPIIGRSTRFENLYLATGHQMLGLQTAPATGRLVADLMCGGEPTFDPGSFRAARFWSA